MMSRRLIQLGVVLLFVHDRWSSSAGGVSGNDDATTALFRAGAWIQVGSFVGAMIMWALVNYTDVF